MGQIGLYIDQEAEIEGSEARLGGKSEDRKFHAVADGPVHELLVEQNVEGNEIPEEEIQWELKRRRRRR